MKERALRWVLMLLFLLSAFFVFNRLLDRSREEENRNTEKPSGKIGRSKVKSGNVREKKPERAYGRKPLRPPRNLPMQVPDIVEMIRSEKPVQEAKAWPLKSPEVSARFETIRLRGMQRDFKEAIRLFQLFANQNRGNPDAAEALFEIIESGSGFHWSKATAGDIALCGRTASRLAEEHPVYPRTGEALAMYVSKALEAWKSFEIEPEQEEWLQLFKAAAVLAGRYPTNPGAPICLFRIAEALYLVQEARDRAVDLLELVSKWGEAYDTRVCAYKALHDYAMEIRDSTRAQELAEEAAMECAGRTSCAYAGGLNEWGGDEGGLDAPWNRIRENGLSPHGKVLLETPDWNQERIFVFRTREEYRSKTEGGWVHAESAGKKWDDRLIIATTPGVPACPWVGFANRVVSGWGEMSREVTGGILSQLGNPPNACPSRQSTMFLPKFPVREGVEVFPCNRIGLVRQEAHAEDGRIVVRIDIDRDTSWTQVWRPGDAWWIEAKIEYEVHEEPCQGRDYNPEDGVFGRSRYRRFVATRLGELDREDPPDKANFLKSAVAGLGSWAVDGRLHLFVEKKARSLFSDIELARFLETWKPESEPDKHDIGKHEEAAIKEAESCLARGDFRNALAKTSEDLHWEHYLDEMRRAKAKAYFSLGMRRNALELLALLPTRGSLAEPGVRLEEVRFF